MGSKIHYIPTLMEVNWFCNTIIEEEKVAVEEKIEEPNVEENETGSMIEEIEMSAGCVADITKSSVTLPSQKELQINDILNSKMLDKAKELFDVKKITVKARS